MNRYWGTACVLGLLATWAILTDGRDLNAFQDAESDNVVKLQAQLTALQASHDELKQQLARLLEAKPDQPDLTPAEADKTLAQLIEEFGEDDAPVSAAALPPAPPAGEETGATAAKNPQTTGSAADDASSCCDPGLAKRVAKLEQAVGTLAMINAAQWRAIRANSADILTNAGNISTNAKGIAANKKGVGVNAAGIRKNVADIAANKTATDAIDRRLTGMNKTILDHAEWLKELSVNRVSPGNGKNLGPDIFGRMHTPDRKLPGDLTPTPVEPYIHQVQRATNGMLKLFNHTGKDQRRIINGSAWLVSPGESYVWVPLGPLTIGARGGEVPEEFGTPTSPPHRQWLFDKNKQWFYIAHEIE